MTSLPITVLIQTKNEEQSIAACIRSVAAFSEVITVDSNSSDRTAQIAAENGSAVAVFTWDGRYPKKKQWQLDNLATKNRWVLFLDADERVTPNMVAELARLFSKEQIEHAAFDAELNRERARFLPINDIASQGMGELEGHYQPMIDGTIGTLRSHLIHMDLDPVRTWFDRHNKYSDWEAFLRTNPEVRSNVAAMRSAQGRAFDAIPGKPALFFAYAYLFRRGFLDGRAGLDYAIALSTYYWQIGVKVRELRRIAQQGK